MKNILKKTYSIIKDRRFIAGVTVCLVCGGGLWWYAGSARSQFGRAYTKYQLAAAVQQNAAFIPGASSNPVRDALNQTLARILAKETKPAERLVLANQGRELIGQLNKEIDAIGDTAPAVTSSIAIMQTAAQDPGNAIHRPAMLTMVSLAQKQMATIEDIRGLSYRANFEIMQICNRITTDRGALTDQYVTELNNELPAMETQFNDRENSYADLQSNMYDIQKFYAGFSGSAL